MDAINKQFRTGAISWDQALDQLTAVRDALYKRRDQAKPNPQLLFHSENLALLDRYWEEVYGTRELVDPDTMYADLRRAVEACGALSLLAARKQELQAAVGASASGDANKHRRVVNRLNSLLAYAGRDFKLWKPKPSRPEVVYLTEQEVAQVLPYLPSDEFRSLVKVAFVTGCRVGECFGLTESRIRDAHLFVDTQIDASNKRRDTKTRSQRKVVVLPDGMDEVREWLAVPTDVKQRLRKLEHAEIFRTACLKAFSGRLDDRLKNLVFHALRHSYAIYLVKRGVPMSWVAQSLGNSVLVCERYYAGFMLADETVDAVSRLLAK